MSHTDNRPVVCLTQIAKAYGDRTIISDLSLDIYNGEFITLLGPSGCGKTTLLRLIAGLESSDNGAILLDDQDITELPPEKRRVNTVFQSYALFPHMTVLQNVCFGLQMAKVPKAEIEPRAKEALAMVKLERFMDARPNQLSGGQQQRVAIARAVVNRPKVLLLDESLSALDYKLRKQMQSELKRLQRKLGITFIFVTHDQEEALSMSDRIVVLKDGEIQQIGTPKEVYETPDNMFVAKFIGETNIFDTHIQGEISEGIYRGEIDGKAFEIRTDKSLVIGQHVSTLLRPEDLRIAEITPEHDSALLTGKVVDRTYKGMTLDSTIKLDSGQILQVSEFFNEDDPDTDHSIGQRVEVSWVPGWEVVLEHGNA
ncbi:spermidine/putrescine ABC transporter ATP-binding protein PotA [Paraferrimonas sedimenticola]|uniref:Spermidine/putrescine import ATP-binding protein PotA n=1 Tax=Paraferrimonas sedimenticola TaxID=375674 RepID=A0AA37RVP5_9GAMM|nr:spermidine/putrescine ABC transporter ATP-binding protein PotA [Paraferrimonas sedimenticola]GLP96098.1 spermidine/putrescine import ATP-binding protein PotA [Paraferrimonas sedimenticola]